MTSTKFDPNLNGPKRHRHYNDSYNISKRSIKEPPVLPDALGQTPVEIHHMKIPGDESSFMRVATIHFNSSNVQYVLQLAWERSQSKGTLWTTNPNIVVTPAPIFGPWKRHLGSIRSSEIGDRFKVAGQLWRAGPDRFSEVEPTVEERMGLFYVFLKREDATLLLSAVQESDQKLDPGTVRNRWFYLEPSPPDAPGLLLVEGSDIDTFADVGDWLIPARKASPRAIELAEAHVAKHPAATVAVTYIVQGGDQSTPDRLGGKCLEHPAMADGLAHYLSLGSIPLPGRAQSDGVLSFFYDLEAVTSPEAGPKDQVLPHKLMFNKRIAIEGGVPVILVKSRELDADQEGPRFEQLLKAVKLGRDPPVTRWEGRPDETELKARKIVADLFSDQIVTSASQEWICLGRYGVDHQGRPLPHSRTLSFWISREDLEQRDTARTVCLMQTPQGKQTGPACPQLDRLP